MRIEWKHTRVATLLENLMYLILYRSQRCGVSHPRLGTTNGIWVEHIFVITYNENI